jgi:hypothetical protein
MMSTWAILAVAGCGVGRGFRIQSGDLGVIWVATATIENDNGFQRDELVRATQRGSENERRASQRKPR